MRNLGRLSGALFVSPQARDWTRIIHTLSTSKSFQNADAVLILTEWDMYSNIDWHQASKVMRKPTWVFDARSIVEKDEIISTGINFWRIGDGSRF